MKVKFFKFLIIPLITVICFSLACEPDDICPESTSTTPRLIIDFYDANNQENLKNVFDLRIEGIGNTTYLDGKDLSGNEIAYDGASNFNNALLPLKTDANTTQFVLIKEYEFVDDTTPPKGNRDTITINYSRELVYVSRACGYKTIYKDVTLTIEPDDDNWMKSRQPLSDNQSVENEFETHFNVTH
ncbi:DUF6452 family protein [uncultured Algibacter sp.]|uniref:DUF6452 family protein n=1 Tax=uncultured Algibacter sp. TaxID=298659 RepID=UPI002612F4D7|nr:DUF6452 family protein [uncultured Algibacter sp.]